MTRARVLLAICLALAGCGAVSALSGRLPVGGGAAQEVDVGPDSDLPFGRIGRYCGTPEGREIESYPEGKATWRIIDSDPASRAPHRFHIVGFADGCARRVTAALVVFGSAGMHEQLRYRLPEETRPYSATDDAYEVLKARVCGAPAGRPCGARIGQIERDTVFVTLYESFGGQGRWSSLLLGAGKVLAVDLHGG